MPELQTLQDLFSFSSAADHPADPAKKMTDPNHLHLRGIERELYYGGGKWAFLHSPCLGDFFILNPAANDATKAWTKAQGFPRGDWQSYDTWCGKLYDYLTTQARASLATGLSLSTAAPMTARVPGGLASQLISIYAEVTTVGLWVNWVPP